LGRLRAALGIRLVDVGATVIVAVVVELNVATGGGAGSHPLNAPSVTRALISAFTAATAGSAAAAAPAPPAAQSAAIASLTDREREIVSLVAAGLSNDEIAGRLVVSPLTAKTHVSRAMIKLAARDRAQLVVIAYQNGLATPGSASPGAR
jgi:DNA-binding NarL/FixJ family response regulator